MTGSRRRTVIVAAGAIAVVIAIALVIVGSRTRGGGGGAGSGSGGSAAASGGAIHAPAGPALGSAHDSGIHLAGFVVDGAGLPVAGAEVSVEREAEPSGKKKTAAGMGTGTGTGTGSGVHAAPVTTADGRFTIVDLEAGRYRVRVTGPGLLAAEVRFVAVPADAARIVVARQVAIAGTVMDGTTPIANAHVGLRGDAIGGTIETTTDAAGAYTFAELPEGRYQIYAWQGALAARTIRINRVGAGPFGPVPLALEAGAIVVGHVIDRDEGTGLVAAIELRPVGDDQAPRYTRSQPDGSFRIEGVPAGTWIADAFVPGYTSPGGVELAAGRAGAGIPELALVRAAAVEGRVVDADGAPIAGATVRALAGSTAQPIELSEAVDRDRLRRFSGRTATPTAPTSAALASDPELVPRGELGVMIGPIPPLPGPGELAGAHTASAVEGAGVGLAGEPPPLAVDPARASIWVTGDDGRYRIRGAPRGKLVVHASAPDFADGKSKPVAIEAGAQVATGVDVVLGRGTFVTGTVVDQHHVKVIGAQIAARDPATADPGGAIVAFTDDAGTYRLGPLAGAVELRATAYGHADARVTLELATTHGKQAAERVQDFVLAVADAELAGVLDDATGAPVGNATIEVLGGGADGRHAIAQPDGTFALDLLPAGPLRLKITHPSYPPLVTDAVAGDGKSVLRVRLPLGGAIAGAVIDDASSGPLASVTITATGPSVGGAAQTAEATSDAKGRWTLGPLVVGTWRIAVAQPGYLPARRELEVPASRAPGAVSVHDVLLALARGATIAGTVRDRRGTRIAGAHVVVTVGSTTAEVDADGQGEFRLRDAPTGDVEVVATKGTARGSVRRVVRAGDEVLGLSIELE